MRTRRLEVLGLVAVVAIALGVFLSNRNKGSDASDTKELVPVLEKRLNDVASLRIEGGTEPFTLKKDGERWVVEEKAGYTADGAKPRQLLFELRLARKLEQMTASPAGFVELGVQEPDAEGSDSRAITLFDGKGEEITRLIVGNRRFSKGAAQGPVRASEEHFVRVAGDEHAWLAAGKLTFDTDPLRWLDQSLLDVPRDRVAAAQFERAEGEPLTIARGTKEEQELKPVVLPEGRTAKTPSGTAQALNALAGLRFDDVARADGFEWPEQADVTSTFWTFDGLKVTAESVDKDGKTWSRFRAEVVDKASRPGVPAETPTVGPPPLLATEGAVEGDAIEPSADGIAATGGEGDTEPPKPTGPTPEELAAEAKKINDKVGGWVFAVPTWKASAFKLKLDDVLAPLPVPTVEVPNPDAVPPGDGGLEGAGAAPPPAPPQEPPPGVEQPPPGDVPPPVVDPGAPPAGATDPGASSAGSTEPGQPDPKKPDPGAPGNGG